MHLDCTYATTARFPSRACGTNLVTTGETGLGKSTLINSLFLTDSDIDDLASRTTAHSRIEQTVQVVATAKSITEGGVNLRLTIVDTPGFADAVNNESWYV